MSYTSALAEMKRRGREVMEFQQTPNLSSLLATNGGKGLNSTDFELVEGGICAALTAAWLNEKVKGTNSLFRKKISHEFKGRAWRNNTRAVQSVMARYAPNQVKYVNSSGRLWSLFEDYGLELDSDNHFGQPPSETALEFRLKKYAENNETLKMGVGVYLTVDVFDENQSSSGHACGLYKSRGGTLYFFDPNIGVYQVLEVIDFLNAWIAVYKSKGKIIQNPSFYFCKPEDTTES